MVWKFDPFGILKCKKQAEVSKCTTSKTIPRKRMLNKFKYFHKRFCDVLGAMGKQVLDTLIILPFRISSLIKFLIFGVKLENNCNIFHFIGIQMKKEIDEIGI